MHQRKMRRRNARRAFSAALSWAGLSFFQHQFSTCAEGNGGDPECTQFCGAISHPHHPSGHAGSPIEIRQATLGIDARTHPTTTGAASTREQRTGPALQGTSDVRPFGPSAELHSLGRKSDEQRLGLLCWKGICPQGTESPLRHDPWQGPVEGEKGRKQPSTRTHPIELETLRTVEVCHFPHSHSLLAIHFRSTNCPSKDGRSDQRIQLPRQGFPRSTSRKEGGGGRRPPSAGNRDGWLSGRRLSQM